MSVTKLILEIYKDLGFKNVILKYSDRPEQRVGDDNIWDKSEAALLTAIKKSKLEYTINKGEGAFTVQKLNSYYAMQSAGIGNVGHFKLI